MGEYVNSKEFYGISLDWMDVFTEDTLYGEDREDDYEIIECIQGNDWKSIEKPKVFILCEELGLEYNVVSWSDKVGFMYLSGYEDTAIVIGKSISSNSIDDKIKSLQEAKFSVTLEKINLIMKFIGKDKIEQDKIKLTVYYSQG